LRCDSPVEIGVTLKLTKSETVQAAHIDSLMNRGFHNPLMKITSSSLKFRNPILKLSSLVFLLATQGMFLNLFAAPPTLVESRWMTDGQDPTYLNLYPLSGRGATSKIYVQADLTSSTPINEDQVQIYLENPILLPGAFQATDSVEVIKGNGGQATVFGVLEVNNDINWALYSPGTVLKLKLRTADESATVADFDLGDIHLYGPNPGGALPDLDQPILVEASINEGNPIVFPEDYENDELDFSSTVHLTDVWKGIEGASLIYLHEDGGFVNALSIDVDSTDLSSGTLNDGVYTVTSSAPKYIKSGMYALYGFSVEDKAGNASSNFFGTAAPEGVQKTVEVVNPNADTSPPELIGPVTVTPTSGDVTTDPLSLTFSFSVKDVGTGFALGTISVFHSTDPDVPVRSTTIFPSAPALVSGDDSWAATKFLLKFPKVIHRETFSIKYFFEMELSSVLLLTAK
jgi:hypothetical protein